MRGRSQRGCERSRKDTPGAAPSASGERRGTPSLEPSLGTRERRPAHPRATHPARSWGSCSGERPQHSAFQTCPLSPYCLCEAKHWTRPASNAEMHVWEPSSLGNRGQCVRPPPRGPQKGPSGLVFQPWLSEYRRLWSARCPVKSPESGLGLGEDRASPQRDNSDKLVKAMSASISNSFFKLF